MVVASSLGSPKKTSSLRFKSTGLLGDVFFG